MGNRLTHWRAKQQAGRIVLEGTDERGDPQRITGVRAIDFKEVERGRFFKRVELSIVLTLDSGNTLELA